MPYDKRRYKKEPGYRRKLIERAKRYNNTERGKQALETAKKNLNKHYPRYNTEYVYRRRFAADQAGRCIMCNDAPQIPGKKLCETCLELKREVQRRYIRRNKKKMADYRREKRKIAKEQGMCIQCFSRKAEPGKTLCWYCNIEILRYQMERRREDG